MQFNILILYFFSSFTIILVVFHDGARLNVQIQCFMFNLKSAMLLEALFNMTLRS